MRIIWSSIVTFILLSPLATTILASGKEIDNYTENVLGEEFIYATLGLYYNYEVTKDEGYLDLDVWISPPRNFTVFRTRETLAVWMELYVNHFEGDWDFADLRKALENKPSSYRVKMGFELLQNNRSVVKFHRTIHVIFLHPLLVYSVDRYYWEYVFVWGRGTHRGPPGVKLCFKAPSEEGIYRYRARAWVKIEGNLTKWDGPKYKEVVEEFRVVYKHKKEESNNKESSTNIGNDIRRRFLPIKSIPFPSFRLAPRNLLNWIAQSYHSPTAWRYKLERITGLRNLQI